MALELTTVDRVKAMLEIAGTTRDVLILDLIREVSKLAEDYLGRHTQSGRKTDEVYKLAPNSRYLSLRGFPITGVTSVKYASKRSFSDVTALDSSTFDVLLKEGQLYFRPEAIATWFDPGWVQVSYDGGMAADTAAFIVAEPSIAGAITREVVARLNRAKNPEGSLRSFETAVAYEKPMELLAATTAALDPRRRLRV